MSQSDIKGLAQTCFWISDGIKEVFIEMCVACCSVFSSCLLPVVNSFIKSVVISSTADTTEHQVQGGFLWGTLNYTRCRNEQLPWSEWFNIPGQFWLAMQQSLWLHVQGNNKKQWLLTLSATNPGASCLHADKDAFIMLQHGICHSSRWKSVCLQSVWNGAHSPWMVWSEREGGYY